MGTIKELVRVIINETPRLAQETFGAVLPAHTHAEHTGLAVDDHLQYLTLTAGASRPLTGDLYINKTLGAVRGVTELALSDVHNSGWTANEIKLSASPAEWGAMSTLMGGVEGSLFQAITAVRTQFTDMHEPTGYPNRTDSAVSFNPVNRTFTIQPAGPPATYDYSIAGVKFTKAGSDSIVIDDTDGQHFIYFDGASLQSVVNPSAAELQTVLDNAFTYFIYWNTTTGNQTEVESDERHGLVMDSMTHSYHHNTVGFVIQPGTGGALTGIIADGNGSLDSHAQFGTDGYTGWDEDNRFVAPALASTTGAAVRYKSGAAGNWIKEVNAGFSFLTLGSGTDRLVYNQFTGGSWQKTEVGNNKFALGHIFATNEFPNGQIIPIMGEVEYDTKPAAQAGAKTEIDTIELAGMPSAEWTRIATVIFKTADAFANSQNTIIVKTEEGGDYIDWRDPTETGVPGSSSPDPWVQGASLFTAVILGAGSTATGVHTVVAGENNANGGTHSLMGAQSCTSSANHSLVVGLSHLVAFGADYSAVLGDTHTVTGTHNIVSGDTHISVDGSFNDVSGQGHIVSASHCVVGGFSHLIDAAADYSAVFGDDHDVDGSHCVVGGDLQVVAGTHCVVGGLSNNLDAAADYCAVFGRLQDVDAAYSVVGGQSHFVAGTHNAVFGFTHNLAAAADFCLVAGDTHDVDGSHNVVGGDLHIVAGSTSAVFGLTNDVAGTSCFAAGQSNTVTANLSAAVGSSNTVLSTFGFVAGFNNTINLTCSQSAVFGRSNTLVAGASQTFAAGESNSVSGTHCAVFGFTNNVAAAADYCAVFGDTNDVDGSHCVVGGDLNVAAGTHCAVFGLANNVAATADHCAVFGNTNDVDGAYNVVGGLLNIVAGTHSAVVGQANTVPADFSIVGGHGSVLAAGGDYVIVAGQSHILSAAADHSAVFGFGSNVSAAYNLIAGNGHDIDDQYNVVGGFSHVVQGNHNAVFGADNDLLIDDAVKPNYNLVSGAGSTITLTDYAIIGGQSHVVNTSSHSIIGGESHTATGTHCIMGGDTNTTTGDFNIIAGISNVINGNYGVIVGNDNLATHSYSHTSGHYQESMWTGARVYGGSRVGTTSGTQSGAEVELSAETVSTTPVVMVYDTDSLSDKLDLEAGFSYQIWGYVHGASVGASSGGLGSWYFEGLCINVASTITGTATVTPLRSLGSIAGWAVAIVFNSTDDTVDVQVTGGSGVPVNWDATFYANKLPCGYVPS